LTTAGVGGFCTSVLDGACLHGLSGVCVTLTMSSESGNVLGIIFSSLEMPIKQSCSSFFFVFSLFSFFFVFFVFFVFNQSATKLVFFVLLCFFPLWVR